MQRALQAMSDDGADEARPAALQQRRPQQSPDDTWRLPQNAQVVLEAEASNAGALRLYAGLGFIRDKRLARYYLSGTDAYRLKLLLPALEERAAAATGDGAELSSQPGAS